MIIVNVFVDFCILVKKGITLLLNAFFCVINFAAKIVWLPFKYLMLYFFIAFDKVLTLLWNIFFWIVEYFCYALVFIFEEVLSLFTKVIDILGYSMLYAIYGIRVIAELFYKFIIYIGKGFIQFSILIYNIIIFLPKLIINSIISFVVNFGATTERYVFSPIQGIAEYFKNTYQMITARVKALPSDIKKGVLEWYNNIGFVKHMRNKADMNRQVLLIDFNSKDAKRSDKKIVWQYYAKDENGKYVRGIFEAFSKLDVHSFLMSEGYEVYNIKTSSSIEFFYGGHNSSNRKVKTKKMIFFLTQLSTYIRAGIPLTDSVRILAKQEKNKKMQRVYQSIIYELIMGENFSNALDKQGEAFPKLLINMLKTSEMTGELAETLDDMADYYNTTYKLRKQTITSMMYPMVVLFFVIVVIVFIMIYVIPSFVEIYKNADADLPSITIITIAISKFLQDYIWFLVAGIVVFFIIMRFLYKRVKLFKTILQWMLMHIPVIKNVFIYKEITMFTKTFSALLQHNVFITDCMEILSKITNNEVYKMIVFDAIANIARGDSISSSFKNHWAVPDLAYEMMLTGERTGQLPVMMGKVAIYYQEEQKNLVNQIKVLIEPIVIVFLTVAVGLILLAVVVPMFSLYSSISSGV